MEAETLCRPDKQQQLWADCEIGVIIHYSRGLLGMQNLEGVPCDQAADASKLAPGVSGYRPMAGQRGRAGSKIRRVCDKPAKLSGNFTLAVLIQSIFAETVALSEWKV